MRAPPLSTLHPHTRAGPSSWQGKGRLLRSISVQGKAFCPHRMCQQPQKHPTDAHTQWVSPYVPWWSRKTPFHYTTKQQTTCTENMSRGVGHLKLSWVIFSYGVSPLPESSPIALPVCCLNYSPGEYCLFCNPSHSVWTEWKGWNFSSKPLKGWKGITLSISLFGGWRADRQSYLLFLSCCHWAAEEEWCVTSWPIVP